MNNEDYDELLVIEEREAGHGDLIQALCTWVSVRNTSMTLSESRRHGWNMDNNTESTLTALAPGSKIDIPDTIPFMKKDDKTLVFSSMTRISYHLLAMTGAQHTLLSRLRDRILSRRRHIRAGLHRCQERDRSFRLPAGTWNIALFKSSGSFDRSDINISVASGIVLAHCGIDTESAPLVGLGAFNPMLIDHQFADRWRGFEVEITRRAVHKLILDGPFAHRDVFLVSCRHTVVNVVHACAAAVGPFRHLMPHPVHFVRFSGVVEVLECPVGALTGIPVRLRIEGRHRGRRRRAYSRDFAVPYMISACHCKWYWRRLAAPGVRKD